MLRGWTEKAYWRFSSRRIPLYLGAMSPKMLRLIGRSADGGLPLLFPPEHYATVMDFVRAGATEGGRDADEVDVAAAIQILGSEMIPHFRKRK